MDYVQEKVKRLYEEAGLTVDWEAYTKAVSEYLKAREEAREIRRRSADWSYIESRPEPLRTALKVLVETGDFKGVAQAFSIPLDLLNEERKKAKIPLVIV